MLPKTKRAEFSRLVRKNTHFIVSGHQGPDGDVIGSTLAMVLGLKQLGKKAIAYNHDGCPYFLKFLPKSDLLTNEIPKKSQDYVLITVDSGDIHRLGTPIEQATFKEVWNVDHHHSNTRFGKHNFIDTKAGSTGQVVYELLKSCGKFKLTKDIAQSLFCTLSTDTGSFRYSNATGEVFDLASRLVEAGAKPHIISEALYETYPERRITLLVKVLQSLKFEKEGKVAKMWMTRKDLETTGAKSEDSEEFVNIPRGVIGVRVICFIKEKSATEWKVSLRSRGMINVLQIAETFGGGGHKLAAGCTIHGSAQEVEARLDQAIESSGVLK